MGRGGGGMRLDGHEADPETLILWHEYFCCKERKFVQEPMTVCGCGGVGGGRR